MVVTIYHPWQHHHLMIASTIASIFQWQLSLTAREQYGKANVRLDASLLQCTLRNPRPSGTRSRIRVPYWRHRSGPSSQLSGPHCRFLACVEDAQRLRLPSAPSHRRGLPVCTGPDFRKQKNPKSDFFAIFLCQFFSIVLKKIQDKG